MKFIGIILLLLTSIFLIACSANQASNKISNSELESLASKYGGVYIFNKKFVDEIEKREAERKELSKSLGDKIRSNPRKIKQGDKFITIYDVDMTLINKQLPRILSNGKPYYQRRSYSKKVVIPEDVVVKLKNFMGETAYKLSSIIIDEFYFDNENLKVISLDVSFYEGYTKYGLFGDEGRGFALSRKDIKDIGGNNKFILNNNKFEKVK
ncbi:tRNA 2-selenouridine synthase [Campylobacter concisus]|uniref:tRNA 2-selenouridine synthase n=1 Tax=Campylobacter concisus TaxID=199 RepID=A0A7S9REQ7_9BACT|nr:tRNA 2-selenouridine synthase [Campylobacter concisus]QPH90102.1 tRNA 2-selenouridine synthase [Campylobacter concisus]